LPRKSSAAIKKDNVNGGALSGQQLWQVIAASAVGTMIEWYDFYIFGSLATVISPLFYPSGDNTLALIAYLSPGLKFFQDGQLEGRRIRLPIQLCRAPEEPPPVTNLTGRR
jgi:hypothetical protein